MPVESAAVVPGQQRPIGPFPDGAVDRPCGPGGEGDQRRSVSLADDPKRAVAVGECEVLQVSTAGFGDPQGVESEQAGQQGVVAARQASLDKEGAEFVAVQPEASRL